jgi:hypothetical protein
VRELGDGPLLGELGKGAISILFADVGAYPENAKETLCRNVTIYGHCRYEDKGRKLV